MNVTAMSVRQARGMGHVCPAHVEAVMQDTWGHLAPKVRQIYAGEILFCLGVHGDITIIDWDFKLADGTHLDGSPWLMTDMTDKVCDWIEEKGNLRGGIWRFKGTFERLKNGKSRWRGKVRPMRAVVRFGKDG